MEKMQESINNDLEELKIKQTETHDTITEIKYTLDGIKIRISEAEEQISELEEKMVEITSEEQNKIFKKMKRTENNLRDLWDNIKHYNIQIIGVPEEEKKKGCEKNFEDTRVKIFPNMEKEIVDQVQEAQGVPYRLNPRRNM